VLVKIPTIHISLQWSHTDHGGRNQNIWKNIISFSQKVFSLEQLPRTLLLVDEATCITFGHEAELFFRGPHHRILFGEWLRSATLIQPDNLCIPIQSIGL